MNNLITQRIGNPVFEGTPLEPLTGYSYVSSLARTGVTLVLIVGVVVFLFMLLVGGVQWMTSGADKAATEESRKRVVNALVGIVILFATWAIVTLIENLFGINIVNIDLSGLQIGTT